MRRSQLIAIVKGDVQGVGFRATARRIALSHQLTGFARNLANGDVEICAQGEQKALEAFIAELKCVFKDYISAIDVSSGVIAREYGDFSIG